MTIWLLRVPLLKTSMSKEWSHVGSLGFFTPALTGSVWAQECGEEAPLRFFSPVGSIIRDASKQGTQRTWDPLFFAHEHVKLAPEPLRSLFAFLIVVPSL